MKQIAHIETPYREKFGVPRQAGLVECEARVVFEPDYRVAEAVRGLEEFDYLWLIWLFHLNRNLPASGGNPGNPGNPGNDSRKDFQDFDGLDKSWKSKENLQDLRDFAQRENRWSPTVRPPRLGGNKRVGVFATRSPFRPNPIGLSCVRLLRVEPGPVLVVQGADLVDGTPILDIKPYLSYADSHPDARSGFASSAPEAALRVVDPEDLLAKVPGELREALCQSLAQDPRPHYQDDPDRTYAMLFDRWEVRFRVKDNKLTIISLH